MHHAFSLLAIATEYCRFTGRSTCPNSVAGGHASSLPPVLVQFYVGCEAALALIMTLFMQVLFVNSYEWFTSHWTYEKLGSGLVVFAAMLTGMQAVVISYFSLPIFLLQLLICFGALVGSVPLATVIGAVLGTLIGVAKLSFTGMLSVATLTGLCAGMGARAGRFGVTIGSIMPSVFFFILRCNIAVR